MNSAATGHYRPAMAELVKEFGHDYDRQIVKGVVLASELAPAHMFSAMKKTLKGLSTFPGIRWQQHSAYGALG